MNRADFIQLIYFRLIAHYRKKISSNPERAKPIWLLRLGHFHLLCLDWHLALSGKYFEISRLRSHCFVQLIQNV